MSEVTAIQPPRLGGKIKRKSRQRAAAQPVSHGRRIAESLFGTFSCSASSSRTYASEAFRLLQAIKYSSIDDRADTAQYSERWVVDCGVDWHLVADMHACNAVSLAAQSDTTELHGDSSGAARIRSDRPILQHRSAGLTRQSDLGLRIAIEQVSLPVTEANPFRCAQLRLWSNT